MQPLSLQMSMFLSGYSTSQYRHKERKKETGGLSIRRVVLPASLALNVHCIFGSRRFPSGVPWSWPLVSVAGLSFPTASCVSRLRLIPDPGSPRCVVVSGSTELGLRGSGLSVEGGLGRSTSSALESYLLTQWEKLETNPPFPFLVDRADAFRSVD